MKLTAPDNSDGGAVTTDLTRPERPCRLQRPDSQPLRSSGEYINVLAYADDIMVLAPSWIEGAATAVCAW